MANICNATFIHSEKTKDIFSGVLLNGIFVNGQSLVMTCLICDNVEDYRGNS